ncbi:hypothetical protein E2562_007914 [Oryza meyeriana var. granulata]|uniref:DUF834 domain-containing protein n=1 Tax=Oryza meyeriana var. granulata TaxID=110450 RepID=A0A6G1DVT1_9ORYZ|nr:hypothetical protein E2562_007914 [Oryza meyeriana var. granulata]
MIWSIGFGVSDGELLPVVFGDSRGADGVSGGMATTAVETEGLGVPPNDDERQLGDGSHGGTQPKWQSEC